MPVPNPNLLWAVGGYGLIMVVLGVWFARRISDADDFFLAGRSLGTIVLIGTILATFTGSGAVTGGQSSLSFTYGFWPTMVVFVPTPLVIVGVVILVADRVRATGRLIIRGDSAPDGFLFAMKRSTEQESGRTLASGTMKSESPRLHRLNI